MTKSMRQGLLFTVAVLSSLSTAAENSAPSASISNAPAVAISAMALSSAGQDQGPLPIPPLTSTPSIEPAPSTQTPFRDRTFPSNLPQFHPDLLRDNRQRPLDWVLIPIGPKETAEKLEKLAANHARDCDSITTTPIACARAQGYALAAQRLHAAGSGAASGCGKAAADFRMAYTSGSPSDDVANAYDLACLGSFTARLDRTGTPVDSKRPALLAGAEAADGILSAIGLLESGGVIRCAGLIRPDGAFYTARHCLTYKAGGFTVRSVAGAILESGLTAVRQGPPSESGVAGDWAMFQLSVGVGPVARTNLVKLARPAEVTLVAPYAHAEATAYAQQDPLPSRAMRYPRDGLCQALWASNGCLQLVCQTVRGFSGAPIVSARRQDGSYDVVGFVSGSGGDEQTCNGSENIINSTFATGADVFGG